MKQDLYVIRGTGFLGLDGTLVHLEDEYDGDDLHITVVPYNPNQPSNHSIKIDKRCLQRIDEQLRRYDYVIRVEKWSADPSMQAMDEAVMTFRDSVRNVTAQSIVTFIEDQLSPMLRMV